MMKSWFQLGLKFSIVFMMSISMSMSMFIHSFAYGQSTVPIAGRYEVLGDGSEINDRETGLIWQRCSLGQRWEHETCAGDAKTFTFDETKALSKDLSKDLSKGVWRIPTIQELSSLIHCSSGKMKYQDPSIIMNRCDGDYQLPTIDRTAFPNTPDDSYWSSLPERGGFGDTLLLNFELGMIAYGTHNGHRIRLVRIAADRYEVLGNGSEIKDKQTGLIWQRCSVGQRWKNGTCTGKAKRFTFDKAQALSKDGWRVPTIRELASLIKCSHGNTHYANHPENDGGVRIIKNRCAGDQTPTIDVTVFPNTASNSYWSSSHNTNPSHLGYAWMIYFSYGGIYDGSRRYYLSHVRLVRAG